MANVNGWDKRDQHLWFRIINLPSYARVPHGDVAISRTEVKQLLVELAEERFTEKHSSAPAVAGRTQGDAEKFFYGESGEPWMYDDSYGPMWRSDMNKAVFQFATEYAALRESARESLSKQKQQFIELVRGIMEYGIPEADAKAALLYLTHEGILKLNQDWTIEASPETPSTTIADAREYFKKHWGTAPLGDHELIKAVELSSPGIIFRLMVDFLRSVFPEAPAVSADNLKKIACPKCGKDSSGAYRVKGSTGDFRCFRCLMYWKEAPAAPKEKA